MKYDSFDNREETAPFSVKLVNLIQCESLENLPWHGVSKIKQWPMGLNSEIFKVRMQFPYLPSTRVFMQHEIYDVSWAD